jgi:glutathione-specific gamma-glutamylcyclotransferase
MAPLVSLLESAGLIGGKQQQSQIDGCDLMPTKPGMMLTPDLVAKIARIVQDSGPLPGGQYFSDQDYDDTVNALLAQHRPEELWVFAYGSLIWKPEFEITSQCRATARGWHRSFCIRIRRWRGSADCPGLMMGLDRGGTCHGMAYRLPSQGHASQLHRLVRRETTMKPPTNVARWIDVHCADGIRRKALAFVVNPRGPAYAGRLALEEVASILTRAAGHWGTGAEYLYNTVHHLDQIGIRDRNLWHLQEMVAGEILAQARSSQESHAP